VLRKVLGLRGEFKYLKMCLKNASSPTEMTVITGTITSITGSQIIFLIIVDVFLYKKQHPQKSIKIFEINYNSEAYFIA